MPQLRPAGLAEPSAASADEDLEQLAYLQTLTPEQRVVLHERARLAVKALRQAGRELYGFDPANPPPTSRT